MAGKGGGSSSSGRDRSGPGGASKSGPGDRGRGGGGGGSSGSGRPVGSTANQSARLSDFERDKMGGANTSVDIDNRVNDYTSYEGPGIVPQVLDWIGGPWFDISEPIFTKPQTYYDGTWHSQTNVPGVLGGLGGGLIGGPVGSQIGSILGSELGKATGIGQVPHSPWGGDSLSQIASDRGWGSGLSSNSGGGPSSQQDNRGAEGGLLQPTTQPGVTPQAPVMPAAQPAVQQAQERKKRMYALGMNGVPGPSTYQYQTAKWL